jgi:hypothetical protein
MTNSEFIEMLRTFPSDWPVVVPGFPAAYELAPAPQSIHLVETEGVPGGYEEQRGGDSFPAIVISCSG